MILSLHIYKTAGTTLLSVLDRNYKKTDAVYANLVGIEKTKKQVASNQLSDNVEIIHGHFPFDWHQLTQKQCKYITFLRDPKSRILSDYQYNKKAPHGHHHKEAANSTLEEYLANKSLWDIDNGLVRFISGDTETPIGQLTELSYNKAIENINNHFLFIGFSEHFDDSLLLAQQKLGWKKLYYKSINKTPNKKKITISPKEKELLKQRIYWDEKLYAYCLENFRKDLNKISPSKRQKQKLIQKTYNLIHPIYAKIKGFS